MPPGKLRDNRYGKSGIRLFKVDREGARHHVTDLTVDIWLEGAFEAAHTEGENAAVLPTDTMRGTVYAFARERWSPEPEAFGLELARHFVETVASVERASVHLAAAAWERIDVGGDGHDHAFTGGAPARRTATVTVGPDGADVTAGLGDLLVLKTARSGFSGFHVDAYTTLAETDDRVLATLVTARWRYDALALDWSACAGEVRRLLLETFAEHDSESLQHTLYAMGQAVLAARGEIAEIWLSMPNQHHNLVDLQPYGLENPNEVFVVADRPFGVIEATLARDA